MVIYVSYLNLWERLNFFKMDKHFVLRIYKNVTIKRVVVV